MRTLGTENVIGGGIIDETEAMPACCSSRTCYMLRLLRVPFVMRGSKKCAIAFVAAADVPSPTRTITSNIGGVRGEPLSQEAERCRSVSGEAQGALLSYFQGRCSTVACGTSVSYLRPPTVLFVYPPRARYFCHATVRLYGSALTRTESRMSRSGTSTTVS